MEVRRGRLRLREVSCVPSNVPKMVAGNQSSGAAGLHGARR
jgi:hypothetical protein